MKKFEYIYIRDGVVEPKGLVPYDGAEGAVSAKQIMAFLNKLGDEGWELIDTVRDTFCTEFTGILMRERPNDVE